MARPLRILLVGNYAPDQQHSMLRYANWLAQALRDRGWAVDLTSPQQRLARLARSSGALRKWLGFIDKFVLFTRDLRRRSPDYDLIHICDHSNAPYLLALGRARVSVTCHDLIPIKVLSGQVPDQTLPTMGRWLQRLIRQGLRRADNIIFVSETTRADFARLIKPLPEATEVIANPVIGFGRMTPEHARQTMATAGLPTSAPFLLHIGSNLWYKNRTGAVRLFGLLRQRSEAGLGDALMICVGPALPSDAVQLAGDWREKLIVVSAATDELVEALYSRAEALLFPSLDEGFGWPIIEAQACGCPVITSDQQPMRDVAGAAALLIDPVRLEDGVLLIATRWHWLMAQRDAARAHAAGFSQTEIGQRYSQVLACFVQGDRSRVPAP